MALFYNRNPSVLQLPAPYKRERLLLQITYSDEAQRALSDCENAGSLLRAINFICQKTWGFKKQTDQISLTQFERALGWSRTRVTRAVDALERLQLLQVTPYLATSHTASSQDLVLCLFY